ncbi:hypothetical protein J4E90_009098 [Alternaria incomplexa]|uniref:uncharacterized protein n=1 Tax=Alternaria incomplexa TaxID=1187928 RepID=UPI002220C950|nr:uncharacterized protein J4E90_009098 [Alternaria incomplexa]KAI4907692.1 hypothetical protein J4E90_009098 [Alternaria incomplexa]
MKYIFIASLLSSAAYAAPFAQVQGGNGGNGNTAAATTGQQTTNQGGNQQQQQQGAQTGNQQQQGTTNAPTGLGAGIQNGQTPTANDLATAVSNWMADTSMVSNFLNTGASIQNNVQFKQAATVAFNAEVDELNHKAIIDAANGADPNVIAANSTLATGGSFQDVVDKLQQMSVQGMAAAGNIDLINQNRCVNVLPNIDAYMASTGSTSQAVRPTVCDQTGVAGGVQGTGPTQPGAPAGSPAAAFAAGQALAQGTGSGQVQNTGTAGGAAAGNTGTATNNGQAPQQGAGISPTNGQAPQGTTGVQAPQQGVQGAAGQQVPQQGQQAGQQTGQQQGQQNGQQATPNGGNQNNGNQQQGTKGAAAGQQSQGQTQNGGSQQQAGNGAAAGQASQGQTQAGGNQPQQAGNGAGQQSQGGNGGKNNNNN